MKDFIVIVCICVIVWLLARHWLMGKTAGAAPNPAAPAANSNAASGPAGISVNGSGQIVNTSGTVLGVIMNGVPVYTGTLPAGLTVQANGDVFNTSGAQVGTYNNGVYTAGANTNSVPSSTEPGGTVGSTAPVSPAISFSNLKFTLAPGITV